MDKPTLTFGSLFSGIGGLDLGLERAGMRCAWQVEIDDYATKVLAKHWPNTPRFRDVRAIGRHAGNIHTCYIPVWYVDVLAGGFPCQDISDAGKQAGIDGERSGLWAEYCRLIRELRPRYVIVENVAALLHRGMGRVLGDLAACGYDAEWQILSAESVGAPHLRERVFIVAYPSGTRRQIRQGSAWTHAEPDSSGDGLASYPHSDRCGKWTLQHQSRAECEAAAIIGNDGPQGVTAYADFQSLEVGPCFGRDARQKLTAFKRDCSTGAGQWATESGICRVANGVSHRMERIRGLGNAVVPQVAKFVGRCIMAAEAERARVA